MLLKNRTRTLRTRVRTPHPATPLRLPPGYEYAPEAHPADWRAPAPHPAPMRRAAGGPPVSGVLATVTTTCEARVHLHRAEYTLLSPRGGYTDHGYAWRCTRCRHVTTGYPAGGYTRALDDAHDHCCGVRNA